MKVQKFMVTIATPERDDCGNSVKTATAGEIRRLISAQFVSSTVVVDAVKENLAIED